MEEDLECQARSGGVGASEPTINIKVYQGSTLHQISLPARATFGELKGLLAQKTGLETVNQRLFFRGKEKGDDEHLHLVGVKERSKVLLLEDHASKEKKLKELEKEEGDSKTNEAVNKVRVEVDKLAEKVSALESSVYDGIRVEEKEFVVLTELLMVQLLKLDGIEAEGEAKEQRRMEVDWDQVEIATIWLLLDMPLDVPQEGDGHVASQATSDWAADGLPDYPSQAEHVVSTGDSFVACTQNENAPEVHVTQDDASAEQGTRDIVLNTQYDTQNEDASGEQGSRDILPSTQNEDAPGEPGGGDYPDWTAHFTTTDAC